MLSLKTFTLRVKRLTLTVIYFIFFCCVFPHFCVRALFVERVMQFQTFLSCVDFITHNFAATVATVVTLFVKATKYCWPWTASLFCALNNINMPHLITISTSLECFYLFSFKNWPRNHENITHTIIDIDFVSNNWK